MVKYNTAEGEDYEDRNLCLVFCPSLSSLHILNIIIDGIIWQLIMKAYCISICMIMCVLRGRTTFSILLT